MKAKIKGTWYDVTFDDVTTNLFFIDIEDSGIVIYGKDKDELAQDAIQKVGAIEIDDNGVRTKYPIIKNPITSLISLMQSCLPQ